MARQVGAALPKAGGFEMLDLRTSGVQRDAITKINKSLAIIKSTLLDAAAAHEETTYASGLKVTRSEVHIKERGAPYMSQYDLGVAGTELADQLKIFSSGPRRVSVDGNGGNDTISIIAKLAGNVDGGQGVDDIQVNAENIAGVRGGGGGDSIMLLGQKASGIYGGAGNDRLNLIADMISNVYGDNAEGDEVDPVDLALSKLPGQADDTINIAARTVRNVDAGAGNDMLNVSASDQLHDLDGGAGNDMISIVAGQAHNVSGGAGDDRMMISAAEARGIRGGTGDDTITLLGAGEASVHFAKGDGRDMINISGATTIILEGGLSAENATIQHEGNAIKISFADGNDAITIFHGFADFDGEAPPVEIAADNTIRIG